MVFNPCLKTLPPPDPLHLRELLHPDPLSPRGCFLLRTRCLTRELLPPDQFPQRSRLPHPDPLHPRSQVPPSKSLPAHQPNRETATHRRNQNYPSPQKNSLLPSMQVKQYFKCNIYTSIFFIKISHFIFSS